MIQRPFFLATLRLQRETYAHAKTQSRQEEESKGGDALARGMQSFAAWDY